jgi:hypothetical protein
MMKNTYLLVLCSGFVFGCSDGGANDAGRRLMSELDLSPMSGPDSALLEADMFVMDMGRIVDAGRRPDVHLPDHSGTPVPNQVSSENGVSTIHDGECLAEIFASPSVSEAYEARVYAAYETACLFLGDVRPLEIWSTANNENEAMALRERWCQHRMDQDPGFRMAWCRYSQLGVGLANYVHWADIYYSGLDREHHQLNLSMFSGDPLDLSAESVSIHEFFHSYQLAHLDQEIFPTPALRDANLGRTAESNRPWHTEGSANFVSWYLTEHTFQEGFLRQAMAGTLARCGRMVVEGFDVTSLTYEDDCAYDLGTWAVAYLVSTHSLVQYLAFYDVINLAGFHAAFEQSFGVGLDEFSRGFTAWFLTTDRTAKLELFE